MKTKLLTTLMIVFGVFLFVGVVSASDIELLQPASTITYNEDLTVNGTGKFNSVYIGETGVGGVTFFNGTIVNIDQWTPVTFGDDVRIDGELWRGVKGGNDPIKISDTMIPTLSGYNDLGSSSNRWKNVYSNGGYFMYNLQVGGEFLFKNNSNELIGFIYQLPNTKDLRIEAREGGLGLYADNGIVYLSNQSLLRLGKTLTQTCNSKTEGAIEYRASSGSFYGCDGSNWKKLDN